MHAHKTTITVDERHEAVLRLPPDFPTGEAEVIVLSTRRERPSNPTERVRAFEEWMSELPSAPTVPLSAFDREEIYK